MLLPRCESRTAASGGVDPRRRDGVDTPPGLTRRLATPTRCVSEEPTDIPRLRIGLVWRPGFTLLEMLLATFVSVLLMGAVYVAVDIQLRHADAGRDAIGRDSLGRALLAAMTNDIKRCVNQVAPTLPPATSTSSSASSLAAASSTTPSTTSSNVTPSASATSNSGASSPATGSPASALPATGDTMQFTLGVRGTPTTLTLYVSKLPKELDSSRAEMVSDLRLISYWLANDGTRPLGLARQEFKRVTSDEANGAAGLPVKLLADEVQSLEFRYFDGQSWVDTWDGTELGLDGLTPIGPPLLIEITLGIAMPNMDNHSRGQVSLKYYRHVVSIATADGVAQ